MGETKAKKPTLEQKKLIAAAGYNWKDLLVLEETDKELRLVYRGSGKTLVIDKEKAKFQSVLQKYHEKRIEQAKADKRKNIRAKLSRMAGRT